MFTLPPDDIDLGITDQAALDLAIKSLIAQFAILDLRVAVDSDPTWTEYWSKARDKTQKAVFALQRMVKRLP